MWLDVEAGRGVGEISVGFRLDWAAAFGGCAEDPEVGFLLCEDPFEAGVVV